MSVRSKYVLSRPARRDVSDILLDTAKQWGRSQKEYYGRRLREGFERLAVHPSMGGQLPEYGPDVRGFHIGEHVVLYRTSPTGVEILRVLRDRRDLDKQIVE